MKGKGFSTKEIILVAVLLLILGYFGYSYFFDGPIDDKIQAEANEQAELQMQIDLVNQKLVEIEAQQAEIDLLGENSLKIRMPSYNAENMEINFLDSLTRSTFSISTQTGDVTRAGDQIRRPITITFETDSYDNVVYYITSLNNSEIRCLIDEVKFSENALKNGFDSDEVTTVYDVSIKATFYETMWDGTADPMLPADKSTAAS